MKTATISTNQIFTLKNCENPKDNNKTVIVTHCDEQKDEYKVLDIFLRKHHTVKSNNLKPNTKLRPNIVGNEIEILNHRNVPVSIVPLAK